MSEVGKMKNRREKRKSREPAGQLPGPERCGAAEAKGRAAASEKSRAGFVNVGVGTRRPRLSEPQALDEVGSTILGGNG